MRKHEELIRCSKILKILNESRTNFKNQTPADQQHITKWSPIVHPSALPRSLLADVDRHAENSAAEFMMFEEKIPCIAEAACALRTVAPHTGKNYAKRFPAIHRLERFQPRID
jgi:hypothetical protein